MSSQAWGGGGVSSHEIVQTLKSLIKRRRAEVDIFECFSEAREMNGAFNR